MLVAPLPSVRSRLTGPEIRFLVVGGSVALIGNFLLVSLVAAGVAAALANLIQAVVTLQANFAGQQLLTWRARPASSRRVLTRRWVRFNTARSAGLAVSAAVFPVLAPRLGVTAAYWILLVVVMTFNFAADKHWAFSPGQLPEVSA